MSRRRARHDDVVETPARDDVQALLGALGTDSDPAVQAAIPKLAAGG